MKNILFYISVLLMLSMLPAFSANADEDEYIIFSVETGHNLFEICSEHLENKFKWREVAKLNGIADPFTIYPKNKIKIPIRLLKGVPVNGSVTFVKGDVTVQPENQRRWYALRQDSEIEPGSLLRTGDDSAFEISYAEGFSVYLRANTKIKVLAAKNQGVSFVVRELFVDAGRTLFKIRQKLQGKSSFRVHTRTAVIGVRGTEFRASASDETSQFEVLKGLTEVTGNNQNVPVAQGEGTLVRKNNAPLPPKKLLPPPVPAGLKSLYNMMPIQFDLNSVENADFYRVIVAKDNALKDVVLEKTVKKDKPVHILSLDDGIYYLQTTSIDEFGLEGMPSDPQMIEVKANPLSPFITSPEEGSQIRKKKVKFIWLNVEDAERYRVQIAQERDFRLLTEEKEHLKGNSYTSSALDVGTYYFRVRSVNADGYQGAWSDILKFDVVPPGSEKVCRVGEAERNPPEKAATDERLIRVRWKYMGKGITYHFQGSKDESFKEILIDKKTDTPEITFQEPDESGKYFVRVSSIDSEGHEGNFSLPQSFEISSFYDIIGVCIFIGLIILSSF